MRNQDSVWTNRQQLAELFDTSKQNAEHHVGSILEDNELHENSVVKDYFTTKTHFLISDLWQTGEPGGYGYSLSSDRSIW